MKYKKNQGEDLFDWLTSWIPNLNVTVRKLIGTITVVLTLIAGT